MAKIKRNGASATVIKAMGIFSGVQVMTLLSSMVRTKLVALWIGELGVGLFTLYNSGVDMLSSISQLGIRSSSVRDIASASGRQKIMQRVVFVVRRWSMMLGLAGAFLTLLLSPLLSRISFGDYDHTLGFVILSVNVFLSALMAGEQAVLQGSGLLRRLAKASVLGSFLGLAVSMPLFRYFGVNSIVPSMVVYAFTATLATFVFRSRTPSPRPAPSPRQVLDEGAGFIRLGIYMTVSSFISLVINYIFVAYLNNTAGTDMVGYYQSGFTIVNRYIGLVFAAIAMEYYPRLCRMGEHRNRLSVSVSHEMVMTLAVMLPAALIMMSADGWILRLLYKRSFEVASVFVTWGLAGTVLRAVSWCMAFVMLARGDGKAYIVTESISAFVSLILNIVGFRFWGLDGLGVAYLLWYAAYTLIVAWVYFSRYRLKLTPGAWIIMWSSLVAAVACALCRSFGLGWVVVASAVCSAVVSLVILKRLLFSSR